MAKERLPMRKVREILRLRWGQGRGVREVVRSLEVSTGGVARAEQRARAAELSLEQVDALDDAELERRLYGRRGRQLRSRPQPDPVYIHHERKRPGVTLELLHQEYLEQHPDGYGYTAFCDAYRRWLKRRGLSMRQVHRAGEKCFTEWLYGQVEPNYRVRVKDHFYSVPHVLRGERIEARVTRRTVELFHRSKRVASHVRDDEPGPFTTESAHMPEHHRWWATQDPERMAQWAAAIGQHTEGMVRAIFASNFHHEQNWHSVWGLRQLAEHYTASRLERACKRALTHGACSYKHVERILKLGRDQDENEQEDDVRDGTLRTPFDHANLRGRSDFVN